MSDKKLNLKVITPEKVVVEETVDAVYSTAVDGEFGILPDHQPYMTALGIGVTKYVKGSAEEYIATMGGIFQVDKNNVIILSDTAESGKEIDVARARSAKERAEARLRMASRDVDVHRAQIALSRALARLQVATKAHK